MLTPNHRLGAPKLRLLLQSPFNPRLQLLLLNSRSRLSPDRSRRLAQQLYQQHPLNWNSASRKKLQSLVPEAAAQHFPRSARQINRSHASVLHPLEIWNQQDQLPPCKSLLLRDKPRMLSE
jgi:hypothetical protein